jgi:hypothetical protein
MRATGAKKVDIDILKSITSYDVSDTYVVTNYFI